MMENTEYQCHYNKKKVKNLKSSIRNIWNMVKKNVYTAYVIGKEK